MSDKRTSVFIKSDSKPYIQVVCLVSDIPELEALGFVRKAEDVRVRVVETVEVKPKESFITTNPTEGDGEVGSLKWHSNKINDLGSKDSVESYVMELTGTDIDKRGSLGRVKEKGMGAVGKWLQQRKL